MGSQSVEDSAETAGARGTNSTGMLPPPYSVRHISAHNKEQIYKFLSAAHRLLHDDNLGQNHQSYATLLGTTLSWWTSPIAASFRNLLR